VAGELHELACALDKVAALRGSGDGDAAAAPELEQSLVAKKAEGAQHGVRVHAEDGRKVARRRKPFARLCLAVRDGAPDLSRYLFEELGRFLSVDLDVEHRAVHTITK
jgi:hypothetical protein